MNSRRHLCYAASAQMMFLWSSRVHLFSAVIALALGVSACGSAPQPPPEKPRVARRAPPKQPRVQKRTVVEPSLIVRAIRGNEIRLRKCFFRDPSQRGLTRIEWKVDREGVARDAKVVASTLESDAIEACLLTEVENLRFGEMPSVGVAEWTFVFRLVDGFPKPERKRRRSSKAKEAPLPGVQVESSSPGWLEPEKIDSVVNYGYRLFARCYRDGIERDESLAGATRLRFVIGENGRVAKVLDDKSDLPDRIVIDCIAETLYALEFPKPKNGRVHVKYQMQFN